MGTIPLEFSRATRLDKHSPRLIFNLRGAERLVVHIC